MIVVCPACATRFRVDAAALGGNAGRRMRCANCGHLWRLDIDPTAAEPVFAVAAAPPAAREPAGASDPGDARWPSVSEMLAIEALGIESGDPSRPYPALRFDGPQPVLHADAPTVMQLEAPPRRAAGQRSRRIAVPLSVAALIAAIVVIALPVRHKLLSTWPTAAGNHPATTIAPPTGTGLKVTLAPRRTGGSLVISGSIVNDAAVVRRIPRLRVTLRDRHETTLASQVIDPPVLSLPPGASAHFDAVFEHPSGAATGVAVSFATD